MKCLLKGKSLRNVSAPLTALAQIILVTCYINFLPAQSLTRYVDPFIGTGGHGHNYPGATVPFGMVQLSPDNGLNGWDWCSGYHYSSDSIAGFSHMHLSGTGIGDWCDISVMPFTRAVDKGDAPKTAFSHRDEKASPGFYSVKLANGIEAAFTTTERCGLHEYHFPAGSSPVIRFDLGFHINWDTPLERRFGTWMIQQSSASGIRRGGQVCNGCTSRREHPRPLRASC